MGEFRALLLSREETNEEKRRVEEPERWREAGTGGEGQRTSKKDGDIGWLSVCPPKPKVTLSDADGSSG